MLFENYSHSLMTAACRWAIVVSTKTGFEPRIEDTAVRVL